MLKIHQPYKSKYIFAFVSIGVLLLGSLVIVNSALEKSIVYAAGDSRTIHDISDMQDMTQQICSNTDEGDTEKLKDSRDPNSYTIVKLEDGNCWMQENLRLTGGKTLTPIDSDVVDNYSMPATLNGSGTSVSGWTNDHNKPYSAYFGNTVKGVYYNWTAAIAMSDSSSVKADGANINTSICPKGWKLPTNSDYSNMLTSAGIINSTAGSVKIRSEPYNYVYTGDVDHSSLSNVNSLGYYWSRTVAISSSAYRLRFGSSYVDIGNGTCYLGFSVRCVTLGGLPKIEKPTWSESEDGNVNVTMPTVITIDAASGMQDTAEASKITEGTIISKVTSNGEHEVLLNAMEPSLKDPKVSTAEISPVSSTNPVQPGNNAWGIWNNTTKIYDPITTETKTYDETITNGVDSQKIHTYQVGISISPALPAGTYATEVTVTAAAK